jgi:hypothetical protein
MTEPPLPPLPPPLPPLHPVWVTALQQYAAGCADALDLWHAIDDAARGERTYPYLPPHPSDLQSAEEAQATYAQCDELELLLRRYFAGDLSGDDLAEEALEVLALDEPGDLDP